MHGARSDFVVCLEGSISIYSWGSTMARVLDFRVQGSELRSKGFRVSEIGALGHQGYRICVTCSMFSCTLPAVTLEASVIREYH